MKDLLRIASFVAGALAVVVGCYLLAPPLALVVTGVVVCYETR